MNKPKLIVIAGCNGSGKSTHSNVLSSSNITSFDYDLVYKKEYDALIDSEFRDKIAHFKAFEKLEANISKSISEKKDFVYETNFDHTPLHWPEKFRKENYEIHLYYFCLNNIEEAKRRVQIRVENGGHHVPSSEIERRYYQGYANLNLYWSEFDLTLLFDSSENCKSPSIFAIGKNRKMKLVATPTQPILDLLNFLS